MLARSSLVVLALLPAGCLKDLTQVETGSSGGVVTETTSETTDTTVTPTATTDNKPACGNGVQEGTEQCDDGNAVNGDGCEVDCTTTPGEKCGNGMMDDGEECDDGNDVPMDGCENNCKVTVIPASCGDGTKDDGEECDDGNDVNTDSCTSACKNAFCGDGLVHEGMEACDEGAENGDTHDCLKSCEVASCGDGLLHEGVEDCDNGTENDDTAYNGCTLQCKPGPRCGDGIMQAPEEECDDGTPDGDDLCNACKNVPFRYIFVTSQTFKGDFNKLPGADARCLIAASELPAAEWTAWLSDDGQAAYTRMDTAFVGWYVLPGPDPILVARDWAGLSSGTLLKPINRDETGTMIAPDAMVWTNTKGDGSILSLDKHCNKWDSNTGMGNLGNPNASDETWTNAQASADCNSMHHLYCVQN